MQTQFCDGVKWDLKRNCSLAFEIYTIAPSHKLKQLKIGLFLVPASAPKYIM